MAPPREQAFGQVDGPDPGHNGLIEQGRPDRSFTLGDDGSSARFGVEIVGHDVRAQMPDQAAHIAGWHQIGHS
jgi:hypothetical protein